MSSVSALRSIVRVVAHAAGARLWLPLWCLLAPVALFADFGLTSDATFYTVDTGAGLVFKVRRVDLGVSTQSPGDIASLVYNGVEYQNQIRGSHVNSGFDWLYRNTSASNVTAETIGPDIIKVTVSAGELTHYYIARRGDTAIYMGDHFTSEPDVHGLVRYIMRIPSDLLPDGPAPSDIRNNTGAIESGDIFGLANGESRSKHYSNMRQMDWRHIGATGPNVGVWMVKGNEEGMSGGPFYRCLIAQTGGDQEVYAMVNYGEAQTEAFRPGTLNLYTYVFNNGAAPVAPDLSWMDGLGLLGWVSPSARGSVSGTATGVLAGFQAVVGLANATAQYWGVVTSGGYSISGVIPGTYTATLFKGELAVGTGTVTVGAGANATLDLASTEVVESAIFRIGEWDGTPAGFLNGDKMTVMHPTDVRMDSWAQTTYTVGVDSPAAFPSIQARAANSPYTIKFNLAPNQVTNLTLKIGITTAYNGGRPQVTVNNSYTTPIINPSSQPATRTITVGTYRGNNTTFTFTIPSSALVVGENTMRITPISGSADLSTWLSAGWVCDAIELVGPIATPVISYVGGSPLLISGTSEPGRNLTLTLDGSTVLGTTVASAGGVWSFSYAGAIGTGSHSVTAVADDGAGHASPASVAFTFHSGVTMPVIAFAIGDTGTYASGATTSDRVFAFAGTAGAGDTVKLTRIGTGVVGTTTADAAGSWNFDYAGISLPDGANSFYATASNASGTSASSPVFTLNLSGPPRVAITRYDPAGAVITTGLDSITYRVTFNHAVAGVTTGAFAFTSTGTAAGSIAAVSAATGSVFDVVVNNLAGSGNLRLDLKSGSGVVDAASGNPEAGYTAGEAYSLVLPSYGNGTWVQPASGGLWSDALNWQNAVIADGAANSASFAALDLTADNTVRLDAPRTLNSLTFADTAADTAASWTVDNSGSTANKLTLAGTSPTITVGTLGTGATTTVSAGLAGSAGLAKAGTGTLVLAGQNSLTGTLNVTGGTLRVAPGGSLALGNSAINTATNAVLNVTGGSLSAGGLTSVAKALVVDGGTATLGNFRTNAVFGSTLRVNGGTLVIGDVNLQRTSGAAADFNSGLVIKGGEVLASTVRVGTSNSTAAVSLEGTGALTVAGPMTIGNQASGGRGGALRVLGNATFNANDAAYGVILSRKSGSNANNIAAATFTGGTSTVEKFTLGYDATVNAGSATITVNGGALYLGSGGIVKNGTGAFVTALNFSSGLVGAKTAWSTAVPVNLPANGNVTFQTADAAGAPFDIALNAAVGGAGGFTKTGAGTLTLDGSGITHTYTGTTTVNGGALRVTGNLGAAANAVVINAGASLTGNGTINRAVALNSGGTLAPGGASAAATLSGASLTWNAGGVLAFDLGAASDRLALTGALAKGGNGSYVFQFAPDATVAPGSYTVATFASTSFAATDFTAAGLPAGLAGRFAIAAGELQLIVYGPPVITSETAANGMFGAPFNYSITATESPTAFTATGLPAGLTVDANTGVISGTPAVAGQFEVILGATNAAGSASATLSLAIAPAPAAVTLGNLQQTYDGSPKPAAVDTAPAGLPVAVTYDGSVTAPTNAGSYAVVATVVHPNFIGSASGTLVIAKATATITLGALEQTYDGAPKPVTAITTPTGLAVTLTYDGSATAPTNAGSYAVTATVDDANYVGSATGTLVVAKAAATLTLAPLVQTYDGTPRPVTATTAPEGLTVTLTYDGGATAPTYPGLYEVTATVVDANYTAIVTRDLVVTITALVRHAPTLNGLLDGSVQVLDAESVTLNGNSSVSGDLLMPGTPTLKLNGKPLFVGSKTGLGAAAPSGHQVTLNGQAVLRYLVSCVDAIDLPAVAAPAAPAGTRDVTINGAGQSAGDFATLRHLTLNGNAGSFAVPAGAYGNFTVNSGSTLVLGAADATEPEVYQLQGLTVNGGGSVEVAGPVVIVLARDTSLNGVVGDAAHPDRLTVEVAGGGVTLNGNAVLHGTILAPQGTVTINGDGAVHGQVAADHLTLNGNALLADPAQ